MSGRLPLLVVLAAATAAVCLVRRRFRVVTVTGDSMEPSYRTGERVLARRRARGIGSGAVVVFARPDIGPRGEPSWRRGTPRGEHLVMPWMLKRVVAVPGDPVPAGFAAAPGVNAAAAVPPGALLVAGDNPDGSTDSRTFGYLPLSSVWGVVVGRLGGQGQPSRSRSSTDRKEPLVRRVVISLLCSFMLATLVTTGARAAAPAAAPWSPPHGWIPMTAADLADRDLSTANVTSFVSKVNNRWVSAEFLYPGDDYAMLRARADTIGPWERFILVDVGGSAVAIRSIVTGRYVSAELLYPGDRNGMLRARASVVGPWERFRLFYLSQYGAWVIRCEVTGRFVSAELLYPGADNGMLRARATSIGPWEMFDLG